MAGESCLFRVPYGSILSCLLVFVGMALFSAFLNLGVEDLEFIINKKFATHFLNIQWAATIRYIFTIVAVVMALYGILLVVFGFLATGATRKSVYSGPKCIMGGKCSALFFLILTYIFNIVWVVICSSMTMPIIIFLMLRSICEEEYLKSDDTNRVCLNITRFGLYFPDFPRPEATAPGQSDPIDPYAYRVGPTVCERLDLAEICTKVVNGATLYYPLAFVGSLLIVIGMASFLIVISVNYQRIKTSKEVTDYRDAVDQETELESVYLSQSRRNFQSSNFLGQSQSYINGASIGPGSAI